MTTQDPATSGPPAGQEPTTDPTSTNPPTTQPDPPQQTTGQPPAGDPWADPKAARHEIERLRRESAGYRTQVREFEEANKTDLEKATGRVTVLEGELTTAQQQAARYEVAMAKGLTLDQAKRLVGATKEELEADADQLRKDLGVDQNGGPTGGPQRPTEQMQRVPVPTSPATTTPLPSMDDWMRQKQASS